MDILPIVLFLLGVIFLLLGWRWQGSPSEEAMSALKGLAYLKREILMVQDQVHVLEEKLQRTNQNELKEVDLNETDEATNKASEGKGKSKLYRLNAKEQRESCSESEQQRHISPKYQEVLELAANGQRIHEIAQHLSLSQDAVRMVLRTQPKGGTL
ncbi:response regulator transcription factor [Desulfosporosinus sp. BG]|uniref:DUF6115 domain-containing protein n=1 Tax=Desulfosporosinus sp. BG TaxID=1633135 RepID=UPI00083A0B5E|nr:response regulator transcription factor [Desulfosporosinus sp. BG]ODA42161.1 Glycosyltransferase [Desulfosporosinus sp. BG]